MVLTLVFLSFCEVYWPPYLDILDPDAEVCLIGFMLLWFDRTSYSLLLFSSDNFESFSIWYLCYTLYSSATSCLSCSCWSLLCSLSCSSSCCLCYLSLSICLCLLWCSSFSSAILCSLIFLSFCSASSCSLIYLSCSIFIISFSSFSLIIL